MPALALYDAVPPWAFIAALIVILAAAAWGARRELRAYNRGRQEGQAQAIRPNAPIRAIGTTDALADPDRYQARQRWAWNVTPERATPRTRALDELERDR